MGQRIMVAGPICRFEVEVATQKLVERLAGGIRHFVGGGLGAIVPFVVFSGTVGNRR